MEGTSHELIAEETYGSAVRRFYRKSSRNEPIEMTHVDMIRWKSLKSFFSNAFLPHGYPESVSQDYLNYQIWDSIQAFASSITSGIATHAILKGAGVGDQNASVLAATMTWLMKDGISMVGRITFSWSKGTKLDSECKKWRMFADMLNDVALFMDLISVHFRDYFIYILCISGLLKSIVGVAGGATRAALTQHQARNNNMADVSAKDGSQETLVNLAALMCSLVILPLIFRSNMMIWVIYVLMTGIHLQANYLAVKSVVMETFNISRFEIYMHHYIESHMETHLSVEEVNRNENIWLFLKSPKTPVKIGVSFSDAIYCKTAEEVEDLVKLYEKHDYLLSCTYDSNGNDVINICLRRPATPQVQLEAMYQAHVLQHMMPSEIDPNPKNFLCTQFNTEMNAQGNKRGKTCNSIERFSKKITEVHFESFKRNSKFIGWSTNVVMFNPDSWHVKW